MTVRILAYAGDGSYYVRDPAHELDGLRTRGPARVLRGHGAPTVSTAMGRLLAVPLADGRRAFDVVVAAPKPVSVLLATDPRPTARRVVELHEQSMAAAIGHLLDEVAPSAQAVAFTHGINRLLDPHLHTHVLVAARDAAGRPVDGRSLRWRARAADALYLAALRDGMPAAASRAAWVGRSATTLVEGVDLGVVASMTTPRTRGGALERGAPKRHPSADEVRAHWDAALRRSVRIGTLAPRPAHPTAIDEHRFAVELGFGQVRHADVVRAWATACARGAPVDAVLRAASHLAPGLTGDARAHAAVVRDDRSVAVLGARPRDPVELGTWCEARAALERYLADGHAAAHVRDPRGASPRTRLALARLDAALDAVMGSRRRDRAIAHGRGLS